MCKLLAPIAIVPTLALGAAPASAQFGPQQILTDQADQARWVHAADLDGDGDVDVLSAAFGQHVLGEVAWYENLASGVFGPAQVLSAPDQSADRVGAVDLDGDGDLDVLATMATWTPELGVEVRASWFRNEGGGSFSQELDLSAGWNAETLDAGDLDGDGDVDVVLGSWTDARIWWRPNLGGGTFGGTQAVIDTEVWGIEEVYLQDLDDDDDADVLFTSSSQDLVGWYENLGGGAFGDQQTITTSTDGVRKLGFADLDGDADTDVLSASLGDQKVAWYANLGGGGFGPQQLVAQLPLGGPWDVHATDLDGDGDADVLSSSSARVDWHENLGGGAFAAPIAVTSAVSSARCVRAQDLDGDGDADVLSASDGDDTVAWYENQMSPGTGYCYGHAGSGAPCPCGNDNDGSNVGAGCANGVFAAGARLTASGLASVSADSLVLTATQLEPLNSGLYFQGQDRVNAGDGAPFGDGLRCAGGAVVRLQVRTADAAGSSRTTLSIAQKGGVVPGDLERYQCWYRNTLASPCASGFNLTNGYEVLWAP